MVLKKPKREGLLKNQILRTKNKLKKRGMQASKLRLAFDMFRNRDGRHDIFLRLAAAICFHGISGMPESEIIVFHNDFSRHGEMAEMSISRVEVMETYLLCIKLSK